MDGSTRASRAEGMCRLVEIVVVELLLFIADALLESIAIKEGGETTFLAVVDEKQSFEERSIIVCIEFVAHFFFFEKQKNNCLRPPIIKRP